MVGTPPFFSGGGQSSDPPLAPPPPLMPRPSVPAASSVAGAVSGTSRTNNAYLRTAARMIKKYIIETSTRCAELHLNTLSVVSKLYVQQKLQSQTSLDERCTENFRPHENVWNQIQTCLGLLLMKVLKESPSRKPQGYLLITMLSSSIYRMPNIVTF